MKKHKNVCFILKSNSPEGSDMSREKFEEIITMLNQVLLLDREAISKMYTIRYGCSTDLERHPKVLVRNDGHPTVSGLGVLNAIMDLVTGDEFRIGVDFDRESNLINKFLLVETALVAIK